MTDPPETVYQTEYAQCAECGADLQATTRYKSLLATVIDHFEERHWD